MIHAYRFLSFRAHGCSFLGVYQEKKCGIIFIYMSLEDIARDIFRVIIPICTCVSNTGMCKLGVLNQYLVVSVFLILSIQVGVCWNLTVILMTHFPGDRGGWASDIHWSSGYPLLWSLRHVFCSFFLLDFCFFLVDF